MNFFDLSDGTTAKAEKNYSSQTNIAPIPEKTDVEFIIEQIKWDTNERVEGEFISLRWSVLKPSAYEGRKVFQKLRVNDPEARDKHISMLAAIDANAGGKLMALGGAKPTDEQLESALVNKIMVGKLGVWEIDGKSGNWVMAISAKNSGAPAAKPKPPVSARPTPPVSGGCFDDDIPF